METDIDIDRHPAQEAEFRRPQVKGDASDWTKASFTIAHILCPIDFSELSQAALGHAVAVARLYGGAEIRALHILPGTLMPDAAEVMWDVPAARAKEREDVRNRLREFVEPTRVAGVVIDVDVQEGVTAERILQQAVRLPADLIVMSTRGNSGIKRLVLGSVTEKVLRSAPCPVLTASPSAHRTRPPEAAPFARILCPVDFSESSMHALGLASSIAQQADARVILLHVLDRPGEMSAPEFIGFGGEIGPGFRELEREARDRLSRAIPEDARTWCNPDEALVVTDSASRAILKVTDQIRAELIVMGLRRRSGIDLMLFGSTTQAVVRAAPCPVLTLSGP